MKKNADTQGQNDNDYPRNQTKWRCRSEQVPTAVPNKKINDLRYLNGL
jgi:hypothetical protein